MRKLLRTLIVVAILVLALLLALAYWPVKTPAITHTVTLNEASLIARGEYLAAAGDCSACHTAPGGKPFAGGLALASPLGDIYSTNITPDKQTGIGNYSLDDFDRALRYGLLPEGHALYPAMPFPAYAAVTEQDVVALYAYFMHGVEPVQQVNQKADIPWPLSMRWPLRIWRKWFALTPMQWQAEAPSHQDATIARGAYLVEGLGHCGSCHTPRNIFMQERAYWDSSKHFLAGGPVVDGWLAVNLRGDDADGLGRWSKEDIVSTLKTGRNPHATVLGQGMSDVVLHSTQHLQDDDLLAIASYLKSLAPAGIAKARYSPSDVTAKALAQGDEPSRGAEIYIDNCAACHRSNGLGHTGVFPAMAGNSSLLADNPVSLVHVILAGSHLPSTKSAPSNLGMPGFAWRLSDEEVAQLATFIRQSWGNEAAAVSEAQVKAVRDSLKHH